MIPASGDALYLEMMRSVPSWLMRGLTRRRVTVDVPMWAAMAWGDFAWLGDGLPVEQVAKDPVFGAAAHVWADFEQWLERLLAETEIGRAEGEWLDLHGVERGIPRLPRETDYDYRIRLGLIPDRVTEGALRAAAERVVGAAAVLDVFTLCYRQGTWGRSFWGRGARWATPVMPRPLGAAQPRSTGYWGRSYWRDSYWCSFGIPRGPRFRDTPFAVAVVVVRTPMRRVSTFWRRSYWGRSFWGGSEIDAARCRQLREEIEATKAAGVEVQIWLEDA
ncbi:hypothetical protein GC173_11355 [bacterium]|nr:hypothetical protein [bacterium]